MAANESTALPKGVESTMFVKKLSEVDTTRDYVIIVDRSASMKLKGRWNEAEEACKILCHHACKCDADGITLYFFSSHSVTSKSETPAFTKYENVASGQDVMKQFESKDNEPHGGTDLVTVLKDAFVSPDGKPLSILVITDGMPDEPAEVSELIKQTANNMNNPDDIFVTIVQVGDDSKANEYLNELDEGLEKIGCKYDIVDVISHQMMLNELNASGGQFSKLIENSVIKATEIMNEVMPPAPPIAPASDAAAADTAAKAAAAQEAQQEEAEAEKRRAEQEAAAAAKLKAEQDAAQAQAAEAARLKAEEEEAARKAAEAEAARIKAEQEAEAARLKAEEDARIAAEEEARQRAEQEASQAAQRRESLQDQMGGLSDAQLKFQNEWDITISTRDKNEATCEAERKTTAASDLKQLNEQNKIKLASKKDANRTAEQVYLENIESDADNDNEWERVLKLINTLKEPSVSDDSRSDIDRMKTLFIQLKSDPPMPRVSAK